MAEALITTFRATVGQPHPITELILLPSDGGRYEVTIDGKLVYSKLATGQHIPNEQMIEIVRERLANRT